MSKYAKLPEGELYANTWQPREEIDGVKPSEEGKRFFVMDVEYALRGGLGTQNFSQYMIQREDWDIGNK